MTLTLANALVQAQQAGLARVDAQVLMLHLVAPKGVDRAWLVAHDHWVLSPDQARHWQDWVQQRLQGKPVAYLTGWKWFYGLHLHITPAVLDPRPDTETLVDWALTLSSARSQGSPLQIVDLGTGSGAIALALAANLSRQGLPAEILGTDRSEAALQVAQANAHRLGLTVQWHLGNWLQGLDLRFDLLLSNPPYLASDDAHLPQLRHEPVQALVSGPDGLDDVRCIVAQALNHLKPGGWLLLEHGYNQHRAVQALLTQAGFSQVQSRQDLAGHWRCSGGQRPAVE